MHQPPPSSTHRVDEARCWWQAEGVTVAVAVASVIWVPVSGSVDAPLRHQVVDADRVRLPVLALNFADEGITRVKYRS